MKQINISALAQEIEDSNLNEWSKDHCQLFIGDIIDGTDDTIHALEGVCEEIISAEYPVLYDALKEEYQRRKEAQRAIFEKPMWWSEKFDGDYYTTNRTIIKPIARQRKINRNCFKGGAMREIKCCKCGKEIRYSETLYWVTVFRPTKDDLDEISRPVCRCCGANYAHSLHEWVDMGKVKSEI